MFTRVLKTIDDLLPDTITKDKVTIEERRKFIEERFMEIKNKVLAVANKVIQKQLLDSDKIQKEHDFQLGDIVWLYNKIVKQEQVKKFTISWHRPFKIYKFLGPITVILLNKSRQKHHKPVHVSHLRHYQSFQKSVEPRYVETDLN
jgi:hypothetical protein